MRVDSRHGASPACRLRRARDHAPRLCDGIDAACVVDRGAERRPIIEVRAPIPVTVPSLAFERLRELADICTPSLGALTLAARVGQHRPFGQNGVHEPSEPDALALPRRAHFVHPIVPIPGPHQR